MQRIFISVFTVALFTTGALLVFGIAEKNRPSSGSSAAKQNSGVGSDPTWNAGPFELTDDRGQKFHSNQLLGKIWLVNFIFTNCGGPCPKLVEMFRQFNQEFGTSSDFRMVSITVDPYTDTPEVLREYRNEKNALAANWTFLTGEEEKVMSTIRHFFRVPADKDPEVHTTKFLLVDRSGQILRAFDSTSEQDLRELRENVRAKLKGQSSYSLDSQTSDKSR